MTTMTEQRRRSTAVFIKATPERIWDAITKPECTAKYFYGAQVESSFEPGTPYLSVAGARERAGRRGAGVRSAAAARPHLALALRPGAGRGGAEPRHVGDRAPGGRRHAADGRARPVEGAPKTAEGVAGGWMYVLSGLKTLLETGEPL